MTGFYEIFLAEASLIWWALLSDICTIFWLSNILKILADRLC
jgi:hypothetical protein